MSFLWYFLTTECPKVSSGLGLKYPVVLGAVVMAREGDALQDVPECGPVASL